MSVFSPSQSSPPKSEKKVGKHFYFLDAIRGVAAMGVMVYHLAYCHAFSPIMWESFPNFLTYLVILLASGVEVFFLLSGFVIAFSMLRNVQNEEKGGAPAPATKNLSVDRFLIRRWIRLTPPYWAACILAILLAVLEIKLTGQADQNISPLSILLNLFYLQPFFNVSNLFTPAWSLCVEVQFYLLFALILFLAWRGKSKLSTVFWLTFVTGVISLSWGDGPIVRYMLFPHWCHFAAGTLIYLSTRKTEYRNATAVFLALMGILTVWYGIQGGFAADSRAVHYLVSLVGACLIWWTNAKGLLYVWGQKPIWQWMGRISYPLYLIHFQLGIFLMKVALKVAGPSAIKGWIAFVVVCAVCTVIAQLVHNLVEKPAMAWSARLKA